MNIVTFKTTIAYRPGQGSFYTNNWLYEPTMGNSPTPATFYWTWVSFCFVFLGFGAILYIYHHYRSVPDNSPKTPLFMNFKPLTSSQRKVGQYFLVVAVVVLIQIGVGAIMAHYYAEREGNLTAEKRTPPSEHYATNSNSNGVL